jgi:hypothetical protein
MLLPDGIYKRIPLLWMTGGIMFLLLGLGAGPEVDFFAAYLFLGAVCITRAVWIYQARWKFHQRNKVNIAKTVCIVSPKYADLDKTAKIIPPKTESPLKRSKS